MGLQVSELLEYPCTNKSEGCQVIKLKHSIDLHERSCPYNKNLQCPGKNCPTKVSIKKHRHIHECNLLFKIERAYQFGEEIRIDSGLNYRILTQNFAYYNMKVQMENHFFFLILHTDDNSLVFFVRELSENRGSNYRVSFRVSTEDESISRSYTGKSVHINTDVESAVDDGNALRIPFTFLKLMSIGKKSYFSFKISR